MLGAALDAADYVKRLQGELARVRREELEDWADLVYQAWRDGRFVFIFGNGGSGTTASHMAEDLGKSTLRECDLRDESKQRLKVLSLTDNAGWLMAVGNDLAHDQGVILATTDGGMTWSRETFEATNLFRAVAAVTTRNAWAAGSDILVRSAAG